MRSLIARSIGIVLLCFGVSAHAAPATKQPTHALAPVALKAQVAPLSSVAMKSYSALDTARLRVEDLQRDDAGLPPRYAIPHKVSISPNRDGSWEEVGELKVWRYRIQAADTLNLNVGFKRYSLPEGAALFLYSSDGKIVRGPFTAADNEVHGEFWSPVLITNDMVVELSVPRSFNEKIDLELTQIGQGYRGFGAKGTDKSGSCNMDTECLTQDATYGPWDQLKAATAVISTGGSTFCTGSLLNNTAQDNKMFFMTANHCGINAGNAATLVTFWNYENSACRTPGSAASGQAGDGSLAQFNTGAFFRAARSATDFTLVEMDDPANPAHNLFWAGWNRNLADSVCTQGSLCAGIHHPSTDEKRITFVDATITTTSYNSHPSPGDGTHVHPHWDTGPVYPPTAPATTVAGVTEPGSSGSPLYDSNRRFIGQLHGGPSACGATGESLSDYYGKFALSWDAGGTAATQAKDWLDPGNTGATTIDGKGGDGFTLGANPATIDVCAPTNGTSTITVSRGGSFTGAVTLSAVGNPPSTTTNFAPNPVGSGATTSLLTIGNTGSAAAGSYPITINGTDGGTFTGSTQVTLNLSAGTAAGPTLTAPANGATDVATQPTFTWAAVSGATGYTIEIATDAGFSNIVATGTPSGTSFQPVSTLSPSTNYFWRVRATNGCGTGANSTTFNFTTANQICRTPNLAIPDSPAAAVSDDMTVAQTGTITDVNVSMRINHTWVGDLRVDLTHVASGTTLTGIMDRPGAPASANGCSGNDINATLDDEAGGGAVEGQCGATPPVINGTFTPNVAFTGMDGRELAGTWRLSVQDLAGADLGTLVEWCLIPSAGPPDIIFQNGFQ